MRRRKLYKILLEFDVPPKLVRLIRVSMEETVGRVRIGANRRISDLPGTEARGLVPMLFNFALEYVTRKLQIDVNATILNKSVKIVEYADDLNILGRSVPALKETFLELEETVREIGLGSTRRKQR